MLPLVFVLMTTFFLPLLTEKRHSILPIPARKQVEVDTVPSRRVCCELFLSPTSLLSLDVHQHGQQLSLFVADLLQSIGALMDIKWVNQGFVQVSHYCTAQGKPPILLFIKDGV